MLIAANHRFHLCKKIVVGTNTPFDYLSQICETTGKKSPSLPYSLPRVSTKAPIQCSFLAYFSCLSFITTVCWAGNTEEEGEDRDEGSNNCHIDRGSSHHYRRQLEQSREELGKRQLGAETMEPTKSVKNWRGATAGPGHWGSFSELPSLRAQGSQKL